MMVPWSKLSERLPRRLTFMTRCGCTQTRYEPPGRREVTHDYRLPLTSSRQPEASPKITLEYRDFVLDAIRFDEGHMAYELLYREKG